MQELSQLRAKAQGWADDLKKLVDDENKIISFSGFLQSTSFKQILSLIDNDEDRKVVSNAFESNDDWHKDQGKT